MALRADTNSGGKLCAASEFGFGFDSKKEEETWATKHIGCRWPTSTRDRLSYVIQWLNRFRAVIPHAF